MYKLGAQGRALQNQLQNRTERTIVTVPLESSATAPQSQQQQEIESFILLLKSHNSAVSKKDLLSYCVNYFPKIRNIDNLRLITALFFQNVVVFHANETANFERDYLIIEAIWAIFQTKLRVSEPTISKEEFFHAFLTEAYGDKKIKPWLKVLVLTGISLSRPLNALIMTPENEKFYKESYDSVGSLISELLNVVLLSPTLDSELAKLMVVSSALALPNIPSRHINSLPHEVLLHLATDLFISPKLPKTIWEHLNKITFLMENSALSNTVSFPVLSAQLSKLYEFSIKINQTQSSINLEDLKIYYFGLITIFQGYVKLGLNAYCKLTHQQIFDNFINILRSLNELNFILIKLGTSGFKSYNFVLLNCINGGLELNQHQFEEQVHRMNQNNAEDPVKLIFVLGLLEYITKYCSTRYFESAILPIVERFLLSPSKPSTIDPFHYKLIIESSHQVVISNLSHLSSLSLNQQTYLRVVISQYQNQLLKLNQLLIITRQVATKAPSNENLNQLLHTIYLAIINTPLYPSHQPSTPSEETDITDQYPKLGLLKALISSIPSIQNLQTLQNWLENLSELLHPLTPEFKSKMNDFIWSVISNELGVAQLDVAIEWWYDCRKGNELRPDGREARL